MTALRFTLFCAAALVGLSAPAYANDDGWGEGIEVIDETEMQDLRGGVRIAGVDIEFGAIITTALNGVPVLTTQLTWTDAGAVVEQTMADVGESLSEMSPEELEALGLNGLEGAGGVVIDDEDGLTALVHNVADGALQNIIVNTATGRDVTQDIDVTLTLPGFDFIQSSLILERFGMRLEDDLRGVLVGWGP
jgi:hypothetical protein